MGREFLEQHTVGEVLKEIPDAACRGTRAGAGGVEASIDSNISAVLEYMNQNDVTLLLVFEETADKGKHYIGVLDVFDIIGYVALQSEHNSKSEAFSPEFLSHRLRSVFEIGGKPGSKLHLRPAKLVKPSDSLYSCVNLLSGLQLHHRIIVSDSASLDTPQKPGGPPPRILTPDMVLQYLYAHLDLLSRDLTERPVRNGVMNCVISARSDDNFVKVHHGKPLTINMNASALLAFKSMWAHKVGAIGIVDDSHALVDVISSADLRNITKERLAELHTPAIAFLRHESRRRPSEPLICQPTTTLAHAMARLARTRLHRLFVVDEKNIPLGVVSTSDVLSACVA